MWLSSFFENGAPRWLKVHRAYAGRIHAREQRSGHFWQGRFRCVAMDEPHLQAALRYVALNPVRARLGRRGGADWRWSSVRAQPARRGRKPANGMARD